MNIKLIADSTCDLPDELIRKHNIRIVPLSIAMGDKMLKDGVEVTAKEIFEFADNGKEHCRTSAINVAEYTDVYNEELPKCDAIIHFFISSEMSACYQNARIAAEKHDNIYHVDARNLSTGIGLLVLDAAELAAGGMAAKDIYDEIIRRIPLLDTSFVIDTLTYLRKGGRCSAVQAFASSVFKIKPCIMVSNGKMNVGKKYRGKMESVLQKFVEDKLHDKESIDTRRIFVVHTMREENYPMVEKVKSWISEILPFDEMNDAMAGGTISCHCGPNALGIVFFRK